MKLQLEVIHDCICFVVASSYDAQTTPNLIQFIEPCMIIAEWHIHGVMLRSYWTTNTWWHDDLPSIWGSSMNSECKTLCHMHCSTHDGFCHIMWYSKWMLAWSLFDGRLTMRHTVCCHIAAVGKVAIGRLVTQILPNFSDMSRARAVCYTEVCTSFGDDAKDLSWEYWS